MLSAYVPLSANLISMINFECFSLHTVSVGFCYIRVQPTLGSFSLARAPVQWNIVRKPHCTKIVLNDWSEMLPPNSSLQRATCDALKWGRVWGNAPWYRSKTPGIVSPTCLLARPSRWRTFTNSSLPNLSAKPIILMNTHHPASIVG